MRRRIVFTTLVVLAGLSVFAQTDTVINSVRKPSVTLPRSNDHLMFQIGYTTWQGKPDSINTSGLPRSINLYFLFDYPFKTNPHLSTAVGLGIATDNIYFSKTYVGIKDNTATLRFQNLSDTSHFKKYKLATAYLEAPLELRFRSNPADDAKSFKVAIGAKAGLLLNAHTKGKTLQDKGGNTITAYTLKENSKRYFNTNRISLTGRIGYGHFSLFTSYQLTPLFKEGVASTIRPMTIGLTISGL
jgi:hypothetical protein